MELLPNRKVPMALRILAGLIVAVIYGGLILLGILLMVNGIEAQDWLLCAVGTVLWVLIAVVGIAAWRKMDKESGSKT